MLPLVCQCDVVALSICLHSIIHALQDVGDSSLFLTPEAQLVVPSIFMSMKLPDMLFMYHQTLEMMGEGDIFEKTSEEIEGGVGKPRVMGTEET